MTHCQSKCEEGDVIVQGIMRRTMDQTDVYKAFYIVNIVVYDEYWYK